MYQLYAQKQSNSTNSGESTTQAHFVQTTPVNNVKEQSSSSNSDLPVSNVSIAKTEHNSVVSPSCFEDSLSYYSIIALVDIVNILQTLGSDIGLEPRIKMKFPNLKSSHKDSALLPKSAGKDLYCSERCLISDIVIDKAKEKSTTLPYCFQKLSLSSLLRGLKHTAQILKKLGPNIKSELPAFLEDLNKNCQPSENDWHQELTSKLPLLTVLLKEINKCAAEQIENSSAQHVEDQTNLGMDEFSFAACSIM